MKALQSRILLSMSTPKMILTDKKYFYTAEDFHWSKLWSGTGKEALELSKVKFTLMVDFLLLVLIRNWNSIMYFLKYELWLFTVVW